MLKKSFLLFLVILLIVIPISLAADDPYKPYLHKATVPEHPKVELYGAYSTNLFPGAGTYSYPIELPKGTNDLQPSLSLSYNSQSVKQRPSIIGAGWSLTQNYIYRDVNFTPSNASDDSFKLILNDASYDLVYDASDGFFHTEIETFSRIQNLSDAPNTHGGYWLITLKDGTELRFGYDADSELLSNTGHNYASRWMLDRITDTHGNMVFYSYRKDPYSEDSGTAYLHEIQYNNELARKVEFSYEPNARPDRRLIYEQGNKLEESRRLTNISVFFNDSLIRRYALEYTNLNSEGSLSSLSNIRYIGNDNTSLLHKVSFDYYSPEPAYHNSTNYNATGFFSDFTGKDFGVRLADLNNDGFVDMVQGKESGAAKKAWLNNKSAWVETSSFVLPEYFITNVDKDKGLRIVDVNNDGLQDLIQGWYGTQKAWLSNASGWTEASAIWAPQVSFISTNDYDQGVRLADFNGDGKTDILISNDIHQQKKAILNTGNGWLNASSSWKPPAYFVKSDGADYGMRLADVNGDGLVDILQGYDFGIETRHAWLNNGSGWTNATEWKPPTVFTSSSKTDNGARLLDVNGDGLIDILEDFLNTTSSTRVAWINNGSGWINSSSWESPLPFTESGRNAGRRIGDVNGDGFADIVIGYDGSGDADINVTMVRNTTLPYLLKNISNEFGGTTRISYGASTTFNNTGEDGISDIGFNVWVVNSVLQNNSLKDSFNVLSNTSYTYRGGLYDHNDSEFRGFSIVNETLPDNSTISHYFHQSDALKGSEFRTEIYDKDSLLMSRTENNYKVITRNSAQGDYFIVHLDSSSTSLFDGELLNPQITNVSYSYDNYSNVIEMVSQGNMNVPGDEKYERHEFVTNTSAWILDRISKSSLFGADNSTIVRETKYAYDGHPFGAAPSQGDITKKEDYLDDGSGNPITTYAYDSFGNLYTETDALGRTTTTDYGLRDFTNAYADRVTNTLGHAIDYNYDVATGNLISYTKHGVEFLYEYDTFGRITKDIDPYDNSLLPTKEYTYDFDGIAPEVIKVSQKTTSNNTLDTYYFYDGFANLIQIKTPAEHGQQVVKNILYDGLFRIKEEFNPQQLIFSTEQANISNSTNKTIYTYDSLSRTTSVINPDGTIKNTTYAKWEINDYDENGNHHTYLLDAYDRIIAVTEHNTDFYLNDSQNSNTTYEYNAADELIKITDAKGNIFAFAYDSLGRKIQLEDPDLGVWDYEYDSLGNLVKQIDNIGNEIKISYDPLNRILFKNTTSQIFSFSYDKQHHGTLHNVSYDNVTFAYTYDDRLRAITETLMARHHSFVTGMTYDSMDRILEKRLPDSDDIDFIYGPEGKIQKLMGYVNDTRYTAFGSPANRTYFNTKLTEFSYYPDNAQLQEIKTDSIQDLQYGYDDVGNILVLNDTANNRDYRMSYDNLDRLTNVSINGFKWTYTFDALGNIHSIVRNHSKTSSFVYYSGLAHAPSKVITADTGTSVYRPSELNTSNRTKVFEFYLVNDKNASLTDVNWSAEFGDGNSVDSNVSFNLSLNDNVLVLVEHDYAQGDDYTINFTGRADSDATDYGMLQFLFGSSATGLNILKQNGSLVVSEFLAENTLGVQSLNWSWNCTNGVTSTLDFNMSANEELLVIMEHRYDLNLTQNITCNVFSADGNHSVSTAFDLEGIKIENYNSSLIDIDTIEIEFEIKNYHTALDIEWNLTADGKTLKSVVPTNVLQGKSLSVTKQIDFTTGGLKEIKVTAFSGKNFSDTYVENVRLYALGVQNYLNVVKNGTTRVIHFLVQNDWNNLTVNWNISEPLLGNSANLTTNKSLLIIIEENFEQGKKEPTVNVFNSSVLEDIELDVFTVKHVGVNELSTLFENSKTAVITALVVNNINPLNVSWQLNNTEQLINSTKNLELNTSEEAIVVIESNFSESGVYPITFQINSSTYNDNETGVVVS